MNKTSIKRKKSNMNRKKLVDVKLHEQSNVINEKLSVQLKWHLFLKYVSEFFIQKGFWPIETPLLVVNPGPEPTLDVFKTELINGSKKSTRYLITSPEIHLKKVLSQVKEPIFQITKVFRNNELTPWHEPEFTMIEWYRPYKALDSIENDVKELISFLIKKFKLKTETPKSLTTQFSKILKKIKCEFTPATTTTVLRDFCLKHGLHCPADWDIEDIFSLINIEFVESALPKEKLVFLKDYPPYAAALATINKKGWADRFEVYWKGFELANAFQELTDPIEQEKRLHQDNEKKIKLGKTPLPIDHEFLEALRSGLPPTAGIALGLERLFMCLFDYQSIADLKWFSYQNNHD